VHTLGSRIFQITIACVSLQPVGVYFRVKGFPNRLCFATMSKKPNGKRLNLGNEVIFRGFDSLYKHVLDIEDQLLCHEVQVISRGNIR
jgi:hypothetical protein